MYNIDVVRNWFSFQINGSSEKFRENAITFHFLGLTLVAIQPGLPTAGISAGFKLLL